LTHKVVSVTKWRQNLIIACSKNLIFATLIIERQGYKYPDFPTCFVAQNKEKNFQVICYLKFFPKERSKHLDSDFFKMFDESKKPSVFWAYCDLGSLISQIVSPVYIQNYVRTGRIDVTFRSWYIPEFPYGWWARDYTIHI
jgi:hypothetical protein